MTVELLYLGILVVLIIVGIIVAIILAITFKKMPTINLVQGKLKDKGDIDINDAVQFLKLTNLEDEVEIP